MSRLYEALRRMEKDQVQPGATTSEPSQSAEMIGRVVTERSDAGEPSLRIVPITPSPRLVALTDPKGLGAEKFRALVTRLENLRAKQELKSLQIISAGTNEGKTLVSGNLAVTLAKHSGAKDFWSKEICTGRYSDRCSVSLNYQDSATGGTPPNTTSGITCTRCKIHPYASCLRGDVPDQPLQILQSGRFSQSFARLLGRFDWTIVDSTPMLPMADTNLWSRLVDGTLLVVREGVASIDGLKKGLEGLDHPKLLGIVLNEASSFDTADYKHAYSGYKQSEKSLS